MKLNIREIAIFGMLGAAMYVFKLAMAFLPNIHPLGVFIIALTAVYRAKALYPIYIYVLINGFFAGFAPWWVPYLYIWLVLWAFVMLVPKNLSKKAKTVIYISLGVIHGLLFGTLYSVSQAIMFGLNFKGTIAWIAVGLPWDIVHGIGNLIMGMFINKLIYILRLTEKGKN